MSLENSENDDKVRCPKCGSEQVQIGKKGFNTTKGICGFAMCGPLGFLFGQQNANELERTCIRCGNSW